MRVSRDQWPKDSPAHTMFAMYRIDKRTFAVRKVSLHAVSETRILVYTRKVWADSSPPRSSPILGRKAADFTLKDSSGKPYHFGDLRGNVVIVDFWATWCGPCRALMPHIEKLHRDYAAKGLVVLGLDVGEDTEKVTKFASEFSYTFPLLLGAEPDVSSQYFVTGYPTTYVIDRNGVIVYHEVGGGEVAQLRAAVEKALGETP